MTFPRATWMGKIMSSGGTARKYNFICRRAGSDNSLPALRRFQELSNPEQ